MVIVIRHYFRMYTSVSVAKKSLDALIIYNPKTSGKIQERHRLVLHTIRGLESTVWRNGHSGCPQVNIGQKYVVEDIAKVVQRSRKY